jgi:hypothetical protein
MSMILIHAPVLGNAAGKDAEGLLDLHDTAQHGALGLEPLTSALDRHERCANGPCRSQMRTTSNGELCGATQGVAAPPDTRSRNILISLTSALDVAGG